MRFATQIAVIVSLFILGSVVFVHATGFTAGQPSHPTLFTDTIRAKTSSLVNVQDSLATTGSLFVGPALCDKLCVSTAVDKQLRVGMDGTGTYLEHNAPTAAESQIRIQTRNSGAGVYSLLQVDGGTQQIRLTTNGQERMRVLNNGKVGIGRPDPCAGTNAGSSVCMEVNGDFVVGGDYFDRGAVSVASSCNLGIQGDGRIGCAGSDRALKGNIMPIDSGVDIVNQLVPVSFTWKSDGKKADGFIAQDVEQVLPELIRKDEAGIRSIETTGILAHAVKAIQELDERVSALEAENAALKEELYAACDESAPLV